MKKLLIATLAVALAGVGINSHAGTNTADLTVTASIAEACAVSTTAVAFGAYDPVNANASGGANVMSTGAVLTTCTFGTTGKLLLDQGAQGTGTLAAPVRFMKTGSGGANELLGYQLYAAGVDNTVWGGTNATGLTLTVGDGTQKSQTVYGTIPKGQNTVKVGSYTDTVVVTIDFTE